jgi:hypothetical protein
MRRAKDCQDSWRTHTSAAALYLQGDTDVELFKKTPDPQYVLCFGIRTDTQWYLSGSARKRYLELSENLCLLDYTRMHRRLQCSRGSSSFRVRRQGMFDR